MAEGAKEDGKFNIVCVALFVQDAFEMPRENLVTHIQMLFCHLTCRITILLHLRGIKHN